MKALNLLLRFLLELGTLVSLGYWGFYAAPGLAGIFLCIAAPLLFAVAWGLFAAHKAKFPPPQPWKDILGFLFLEIAAVSLALAGQVELAIAFAGTIAGNAVLLRRATGGTPGGRALPGASAENRWS